MSRLLPDRELIHRLEGISFRPVFILGSARSGTSIMYRLLAETGCFNFVAAYHLVRYDEVLSNHVHGTTDRAKLEMGRMLRGIGTSGSRFDKMEVSPDFPEEYGFALTTGQIMRLSRRTLPRFVELCRKVQFVSQPGRPLLLKNPWDSRNFLYIKERFPESKFLFIHRHPIPVIGSLLGALRSLLRSKNAYHALLAQSYDRMMEGRLRRGLARLLFSSRAGLGPRIVGRQVARTARYFLDNIDRLPAADHLSLRYEDLCADPAHEVRRVLRFLRVEEKHKVNYRSLVQPRQSPLPEDVRRSQASLLRRFKLEPYLDRFGYDTGQFPVRAGSQPDSQAVWAGTRRKTGEAP